jgi:hypothetical protein
VVLVAAGSYLASVQHRRRQRMPVRLAEPPVAQPTLHPRSSRATSGRIGLAAASEQADGTPGSVPETQLRP